MWTLILFFRSAISRVFSLFYRGYVYISPKMPANVFLRFFMVSSVSSSVVLFCCTWPGTVTMDPWRLKFALTGCPDWWLVTLLSETTRIKMRARRVIIFESFRLRDDNKRYLLNGFYLKNLVSPVWLVVPRLVWGPLLGDPYWPTLASITWCFILAGGLFAFTL